MLLLVASPFMAACHFVDPGEETVVAFTDSEIRLPIYRSGDYMTYDVKGYLSSGGTSPNELTGNLSISYSIASDAIILPANLDPAIDPTKILKQTILLNVGWQKSTVRYIYQNQDSTDPLYGAMYLIAVGGQSLKYSWPGQGNLIAPQMIHKPVIFADAEAKNGILDAVSFKLYIDCDGSGIVNSNCANQWLTYLESSQLTNTGSNGYQFFYDEVTYETAAITKNAWDLSFENQPFIDAAISEGFSGASLGSDIFCATTPSAGSAGFGSGQYFYLNRVGVVIMSAIYCNYTAVGPGTSQTLQIDLATLNNARIGGVNLKDIL